MHVLGIRLRITGSWAVLAVYLAMIHAGIMIEDRAPVGLAFALGAVYSVGFGSSIVAHELGHSKVFERFGGEITEIRLWFLGGLASMAAESKKASEEFWVAIAGPAVSLASALVFYTISVLCQQLDMPSYGWYIFSQLAFINLVLGIFNLVPFFPLDGGRVLRSALWGWTGSQERGTRLAAALSIAVSFVVRWSSIGLFAWTLNPGWLWAWLLAKFVGSGARAHIAWIRDQKAQG